MPHGCRRPCGDRRRSAAPDHGNVGAGRLGSLAPLGRNRRRHGRRRHGSGPRARPAPRGRGPCVGRRPAGRALTAIRRVWVTRAEPGAARTAGRLTALGFDPVVAPLLAIRPIPQGAPDLTAIAALAFTSANGVAAFTALTQDRTRPVFTVGDATAQAARAAGFARVQSAGGDLHSLAVLLIAQGPGISPLLVPGAVEPAGDLPALLRGRVEARTLPLYEAIDTGAAPAIAFDAVLIHSARAGRALAALGPFAGQLAFALSAAAADPLGDRSGLEIRLARTPDETALLAALGNPVRRV